MGGGGGGMETDIIRTPEQQQMFGYGTQAIDRLFGAMGIGQQPGGGMMAGVPQNLWANQGTGQQSLWNVPQMPQAPTAPSAQGMLTGVPQYNIPAPVMPSQGWFGGIAPEVQQGLWEPVHEAGRQMRETFGSRGQLGSARAGPSGAFGAATGELYGRAAPQIGQMAWNMVAPQQMQFRQEQLAQGQQQHQLGLQEAGMDYQQGLQQQGRDYSSALNFQQQQLQGQMAPWQMFPQFMGANQAFLPETISYQNAPSLGNQLLGAGMGALAGGIGGGLGTAAGSSLGGLFPTPDGSGGK